MNKEALFLEFEKITEKIFDLDVNDKDVVQDVEKYVAQRQEIIDHLKELDDKIPKEILNRVMQKNIQAETKLEEIMLSIKEKLNTIVDEKARSSKKKKAHRGYLNIGHQNDGYFIDNKK